MASDNPGCQTVTAVLPNEEELVQSWADAAHAPRTRRPAEMSGGNGRGSAAALPRSRVRVGVGGGGQMGRGGEGGGGGGKPDLSDSRRRAMEWAKKQRVKKQ